jgi:flagellar biogenesis protein FliO
MVDIGPPIGLMAIGLILWLAVTASVAGISIQTIGIILFVVGVVWLVIELVQTRSRRTAYVADAPVASRERVVERDVV